MAGKYCPECNKIKTKALMVVETTAKWFDGENFFVPDGSNADVFRAYEKCLACGSILVDPLKKERSHKRGKRNSKSSPSRKRSKKRMN
jgi:hypothetical protein